MVTLLSLILEQLNKHKRRMLESIEAQLSQPQFLPVRKKILRELGKDEFEKELKQILKQYAERHGKGNDRGSWE